MAKPTAAPKKPVKPQAPKKEVEKASTVTTLTSEDGATKDTVIEDESIIDPATAPSNSPNWGEPDAQENAVDGEWVAEKLSPYLEAYPNQKEFHITSDGQVFLNETFAKEHQRSLKDGKEVVSFIVEKKA